MCCACSTLGGDSWRSRSRTRVPPFTGCSFVATKEGAGDCLSSVSGDAIAANKFCDGYAYVLEICIGFGGTSRLRREQMDVTSGLAGYKGAPAGSRTGTRGQSDAIRTGIVPDSKVRRVVASWIQQARFDAQPARFAQELGKCLFVTRLGASVVHCASKYAKCPIDN